MPWTVWTEGAARVQRSSSFANDRPFQADITRRTYEVPERSSFNVGFRVARDAR